VSEVERGLGPFVALFGTLLEPHFARRHDGDFRHGEHAVGEDQQQDDGEFDGDTAIVYSRECSSGSGKGR